MRKAVGAGTLLLLILGIGLWWLKPTHQNQIAEGFVFHPDSVLGFSWTSGDQTHSFARANRNQPWAPAVDSAAVQEKLNALGTLAIEKMSAPSDSLVTLELNFGPGNIWKGTFGSEHFVWTEGTHKGHGFKADQDTRRIFSEGEFAFEARQWNWCEDRPVKMRVQIADGDFALENTKGQWLWTDNNKARRPIDATTVEKWLSKACQVKVTRFRDARLMPPAPSMNDASFRVTFAKGSELELRQREEVWMPSGSLRGVESPAFTQLLNELAQVPH
ncbi:MAG: hypothetical protein KF799_15485 [Bdellovibrionales bacterium]|nr:hypothetical protein [Bdellovibrionales bacterium]